MSCRVAGLLTIVLLCSHVLCAGDPAVDLYVNQIKPLFRKSCVPCHGALKQEAGLRLDTAALMHDGGIIDIDDTAASELLIRVRSKDPELRMPPEHEGEPLGDAQVKVLLDWIESGAAGPEGEVAEKDPADHWSFKPLRRPDVPEPVGELQIRNPIDAFVAVGLAKQGLRPQREASHLTQIRRLYFDLVGVPPTPQQLQSALSQEGDEAYAALVDILLRDPGHGQRWGRHWMDIWRYSDWWGLNQQLRNSQKHMWHWRDWIVESLNENVSYDEMIRCMLAADELYPDDPEKLRATGYLARNYFLFNRNQWMEETVEHVSKGLLGITMNCAKCHDHKYDPIEQTDFYRMRAFFEPYHVRQDFVPGHLDANQDGIPRVFDGELTTPTYRFVRGEEGNADTSQVMLPGVPGMLNFAELQIEAVDLPPIAYQPERRAWVAETHLTRAKQQIQRARAELEKRKQAARDGKSVSSLSLREAAQHCDVALLNRASLQKRIRYQELCWDREDLSAGTSDAATVEPPDNTVVENVRRNAIRLRRRHDLASARLQLTKHQLELEEATTKSWEDDEKKKQELSRLEKAITESKKRIQDAESKIGSPFSDSEEPKPLRGAIWSATRFQHSGKDDPSVEFPRTSTGRRTALAHWITDHRNPLTARVAVNHIWSRHFGSPLVDSAFDFGRNGTPPRYPELLDWLACEFIDSGWDMKHLHRLILSSTIYRLASDSNGCEENVTLDAENRWLWRREPQRLESQVLRDTILHLAGDLDFRLEGPSISASAQANSKRRSLYFFHSKNERNLFLTTFDEARVTDCYRRETSVVPQQALAMSNSQLSLDYAPKIASVIEHFLHENSHQADPGGTPTNKVDGTTFIAHAFRLIIGDEITPEELRSCQGAMERWRQSSEADSTAARTWLVWVLLNHNDTVTIR